MCTTDTGSVLSIEKTRRERGRSKDRGSERHAVTHVITEF